MGWHRSFSHHSHYLLHSFFPFPAATELLLFSLYIWWCLPLSAPSHFCFQAQLSTWLALIFSGGLICISLCLLLSVSPSLWDYPCWLEKRGMYLCLPHASAHFYQQTAVIVLWLQSRQLCRHLLSQFPCTWNWEEDAVVLCLLIRLECFSPSINLSNTLSKAVKWFLGFINNNLIL